VAFTEPLVRSAIVHAASPLKSNNGTWAFGFFFEDENCPAYFRPGLQSMQKAPAYNSSRVVLSNSHFLSERPVIDGKRINRLYDWRNENYASRKKEAALI